jgi:hypothetical protein
MKGAYTASTSPFNPNYSVGKDNVYTDVNTEYSPINPPPPDVGYFLELQGGPFILLNGQDMTLL